MFTSITITLSISHTHSLSLSLSFFRTWGWDGCRDIVRKHWEKEKGRVSFTERWWATKTDKARGGLEKDVRWNPHTKVFKHHSCNINGKAWLGWKGVAARTESVSPSFYNKTHSLPVLREQKAPDWWATDGKCHGNHAVPHPQLSGRHVVVQQEERKHGDSPLFAWTQNTGLHQGTHTLDCKCSFLGKLWTLVRGNKKTKKIDRIIENVLHSYHIASDFSQKLVLKNLILTTYHSTNLIKIKHSHVWEWKKSDDNLSRGHVVFSFFALYSSKDQCLDCLPVIFFLRVCHLNSDKNKSCQRKRCRYIAPSPAWLPRCMIVGAQRPR